jgi:hypothetical protein
LAAKAFRGDPTLTNEFNLATGYQHTGRSDLAVPLYRDVSARGQYIHIQPIYDYDDAADPAAPGRLIDSTLGQESDRRLNMIAGLPAPFNQ